jgi:hypothetical protein
MCPFYGSRKPLGAHCTFGTIGKPLMKQCGNLLFFNFQTKAKVIEFRIIFIAEN